MKPLLSIIVPCYNQAQYLDECLQSVCNQTFQDWECIIVNDGSPDHTEEVAQPWILKDNRFSYLYSENKGVSNARNIGIEKAKGQFILPLDADDKISNDYTALAINEFQVNKELTLVYCKAKKFGDLNEDWILDDFSLQQLAIDNMIFCSAIYKKTDWEKVGGYDINMITGLEDWEFWIALLKDNAKVVKLDIFGFYYRIKLNSRQKNLHLLEKKELFKYLSVKHAGFFVDNLGSFMQLSNQINQLENDHYKKVTDKKKALKIFLKNFFGINFFKK